MYLLSDLVKGKYVALKKRLKMGKREEIVKK